MRPVLLAPPAALRHRFHNDIVVVWACRGSILRPDGCRKVSTWRRGRRSWSFADGRAAQKQSFGGKFFPNVIETASGLIFAEFFQHERDTGGKGIVVLSSREGDR